MNKLFVVFIVAVVSLGIIFFNDFRVLLAGFQLQALGKDLAQTYSKPQESSVVYDLSPLLNRWPEINQKVGVIEKNYQHTRIMSVFVQPDEVKQWLQYYYLLDSFISTLDRPQQWLVMMQNSNELRSSGGFMGSYALVRIENQQITELIIEDVYDADGQWSGYIEPPPGVKEYLSGGKGWRLPDANWAAEFPSAAQQVQFFIEETKRTKLDGVIAINSQFFASILDVIGTINLPDYSFSLSADTVDDLLQDRPNEFFPGSRQKVHLLTQAKNQALARIFQLDQDQTIEFVRTMLGQLQAKNILIYSTQPQIQEKLTQLSFSGEWLTNANEIPLIGLIESNVGINKVNQWVERQVTVTLSPDSLTIEIILDNQATLDQEKNQGLYVNYMRVVVPSYFKLNSVLVNGSPVAYDSTPLSLAGQKNSVQIGWLVTTPARSQTATQLVFTLDQRNFEQLKIIKQSGLDNVPYQVVFGDQRLPFQLNQDQLIQLTPQLELIGSE